MQRSLLQRRKYSEGLEEDTASLQSPSSNHGGFTGFADGTSPLY